MDANMSPRILLMLLATFASCLPSNAVDTDETYSSLFGAQSEDRPPSNNSVTTSAEKSADYILRLLQMFGPIKGNTMLGFTDIDGTSDRHLKFKISVKRTKVLTFAELQLYKLPHDQTDRNFTSTASVIIFDIYSGKRLSSQTVSVEAIGWINFTLPLDVIYQWNEKPERNAGIKVDVSDPTMSPLIRFATKEVNSRLEVLLLIHTTDLSKSFPKLGTNFTPIANPFWRMRRSLHPNHRGPCGRHELSVHFKDLGWDKWIIAPSMYSAYYCAGTCKNADVTIEATNHARIQLYLSEHDSNPPAPPCCVPREFGSIDLLVYGEPGQGTYILKKMEEFVVMSCACL